MTDKTLHREEHRRAALDLLAEAGHGSILPVCGLSMWPVLRPGELVRVRHGVQPGFGDIAVVRIQSRTVAHRVIARRTEAGGARLRLKGDANLTADGGWFELSEVIGVVEGIHSQAAGRPRPGVRGAGARLLACLSALMACACLPLAPLIRAARRARRAAEAGVR